MLGITSVLDGVLVAICVVACVALIRTRVTACTLAIAAVMLAASAVAWVHPLADGPIGRLFPVVIAFWLLPGFLVLELLFPRLARRLDAIERAPLMFSLSLRPPNPIDRPHGSISSCSSAPS